MTESVAPVSAFPAWLRWRRPLMAVAAAAALWSGVLGWWLPDWLRPRIEAAATQALGTPVALAGLHIHPWRLVVALDGLRIGPQAKPLMTLAHAETQLSLQSLWRMAPVLSRVSLVQPELWVERQSAQQFNFSPVLARLQSRPASPQADAEPARFAIFNISLHKGQVHYTDRVLNQVHRVEQLQLGVPFLSNLPSDIAVDVQPLLSARIDGSPLLIKGRTQPFADGLRSQVKLDWRGVDLPHWVAAAQPLLPTGWRGQADQGQLDVDLTVAFESRPPPAVPRLAIEGAVQLRQLALRLPAAPGLGAVQTSWDSLRIDGLNALPLEQQLHLQAIKLDGLQWRSRALPPASSARTQAKAAPATAAPHTAAPAPGAQGWAWRIDRVHLQAGRVDVQTSPEGPGSPPWPALAMLQLQADGLDSRAQAKAATWQMAGRDEHDASLQAHGQLQVARQQLSGQLNLGRLALAPWVAPLGQSLQLPLRVDAGELGVQAQFQASLTGTPLVPAQARLMGGRVLVSQLAMHASARAVRDQITWHSLTLEGIEATMDLQGAPALRSLSATLLDVDQLDAALTRGPQGQWLGMGSPQAGAGPAATAARPGAPAAQPPQLLLKALSCRACALQVDDQTVSPAPRWALKQADLQVGELSADLSRPITIALNTLAQGAGRLQFKGEVRPEPLSVDAHLALVNLDLRAVQPYIDPLVNIRLAAAKAQADGQLKLQMPARGPVQLRYKGRAGLSALRVQDRVNEADFLSWQALTLDGMELAISSGQLDANLGRIALKDFDARLIINPDGQLNLAGIVRQPGTQAQSLTTPQAADAIASAPAAAPAVPAAPAASASVPAAPASAPPRLRWQQIQLDRGRVHFTDNFIKPNYSARLTQIQGQVSAVSSTQPEPATVQIAGAVDDAAPLQITGKLHPLGPQLYTDIQASAKGIELTRLSPYAARYAGYAIDKGTLSVNVHYLVEGGKLQASNQIFLDQLTFGDKTNSPDATSLPVRLAVSLLKNGRGEIDIKLPISGSLDDPQFSVGGILWRVIVNLITKAITAPFALLSGGSDELGLVGFAPGLAELDDSARQRLDSLATKLVERPGLKLEATGRADPAVDVEGLRQAHLEWLMRQAKARATGQAVAEVQIAAEERASWLSAAYKGADIKKPRNLIGLAKAVPSPEMEALLKASAPVGPAALKALADQRGDQVKAYLAGKMPPERVLLTASKVGTEGLATDDKAPTSRVQFSIK